MNFKLLAPHAIAVAVLLAVAAVWALVAQGRGWCLGFRSQRARPPSGTVAIPVEGLDLPWGIDLLARRQEPSAAVRVVRRLLRDAGLQVAVG